MGFTHDTLKKYLAVLGIGPICFHSGTRSLYISREAMTRVKQLKENPGLLAHLRSAAVPHASDQGREEPMDTTTTDPVPAPPPSGTPSFPIVGIGASAGGLEAFTEILRFLPSDTGMAYVLVQHLDPARPSLLANLLARATAMEVREARDGLFIEADHVYVIPPNTDMTLSQGALTLVPQTTTEGQHLSIDTFLRSLAESQAERAIGVILSGAATDGTRGLEAIKARGGITLAQDAHSASFASMPQSAIVSGCVDFIGSPEQIAEELARMSRHPYLHLPPGAQTDEEEASAPRVPGQDLPEEEQGFQRILRVLRRRTGVDFTAYKSTTLKRRILRRMALAQEEDFARYLSSLSDHPAEREALYQDLLIGVTSFFREPMSLALLAHEVFPRLVETKSAQTPIRMWVPGCSTGEEVYSLAICLLEFLTEREYPLPIQLFGTDLNAQAIERARAGRYSQDAVEHLSAARRERFFERVNGNYQISKAVRDLCVFAPHDLLSDPPFARLDVLSCQNLLIYLKPEIQQKLIQIFHYALLPQGVLLLGSSETIGTASDLFAPLGERKQQVYVKKAGRARPPFVGPVSPADKARRGLTTEEEHRMQDEEHGREGDLQQEADHLLLARYAPASVVVDAQMEILYVRGHTSPYLEQAQGRASLNLFRMARAGLDLELRAALSKAKKSGRPVKKTGIQIRDRDRTREVAVEIIPMKAQASEPSFLILFEEGTSVAPAEPSAPWSQDGASAERAKRGAKDRRIQHLEQELEARSEQMRSLIEEQEAANEELQAANEEILSSNEELQSLNEELETSREEIQASNEELLVVNAELRQRNAQAQEAREFADAIVETVREPLLVLDADLRVQRANQAFYRTFQVTPADTERHHIFELGEGHWNIPTLRILLEELLPTNHAFADYEVEHTFPGIGHRIILLNAQRIDSVPLILLALEDITERKRIEGEKQQILEQREEFMAIASHELKTPVTSLKGYTQILQARFTKAGDERSAAALARMNAQLDKLIHLIGELLDMTSIEAGKLPWRNEHIDLEALTRDIVEEVSQITERHQIRIEGAARTPVYGDPERIGQVLTNLLTNAIKYSPQAETILVKLSSGAEGATVSVQDFGIGIAPEKQGQVFERFFRVSDPEHATFPGLGLGLFISAQIIQRHGGRMWVDSQLGVGSTFFFTVLGTPRPASGPLPQALRQEGEEEHAEKNPGRR